MRSFLSILLFIFFCGCTPTSIQLATLPVGCVASGEIVRSELAQPGRGDPYSYRVYLPPCFAAESEKSYPVLYLVPGRGSSPDGWLEAGLPEVVDRLILAGQIRPFIIIATENIDSDPFADTIYKELVPFVENQYPIASHRRYRAVAGGSLGGIAAYRLAFQYPDTFSSAGIFGAGAITGEEMQIRAWLARMTDTNRTRVFINSGERDPLMFERAQVMKSMLDEVGLENHLYVEDGEHAYTSWIANFEMYLRCLAETW